MDLIATCSSGIEGILSNELKHLGYNVNIIDGKVWFHGDFQDIIYTNLWLRTADRVKIVISKFNASTFDELFDNINRIPWENWLSLDSAFPVNAKSKKSKLHNVPSIQSISKKAIVEHLKLVYHHRTGFTETGSLYPIEVSINKDKVLITLDTSGSSLFKRGYRVNKGSASLKENMAAALIYISHWYPEYLFLDPVCGSGTIPIEAALIGCNIAPGLKRHFAFEYWNQVDKNLVQDERLDAKSKELINNDLDIMGYDINGDMIDIAKLNANEAGVLHSIHFKQLAVKDFRTSEENGIIIANPPYGKRLGKVDSVHDLYRQMGVVYRPLLSWNKYFLTSDLKFEYYYGEKAVKKRKLYNGALRTDLFQYYNSEY